MHFIMGERRENMEGVGSEGGGWSRWTLQGEPADDGKRLSRWTFQCIWAYVERSETGRAIRRTCPEAGGFLRSHFLIIFLLLFLLAFFAVFGRILEPFWSQFGAQNPLKIY